MSTDLLSFEHPSVLLFSLYGAQCLSENWLMRGCYSCLNIKNVPRFYIPKYYQNSVTSWCFHPGDLVNIFQSLQFQFLYYDFALRFPYTISIYQTFRFWEATSNLRPPMAFLSHIRYAIACSCCECFNLRARRLPSKLLGTGICQGTFEIVAKEVL